MITAIDKNTALVLIDLQKGILKMNLIHPIQSILEKSALLVEGFRKAGLPIVIVNVVPAPTKTRNEIPAAAASMLSTLTATPDFADIAEEIKTQPSDIFITKHTWNAFYNTTLHAELQKRQVTGIVLGGVSTSRGVEGTARAAAELGYNLSFATDAMTDASAESHANSLQSVFPRLGEQGTSADILQKTGERIK